jgi:hypothetical protein
MQSLGDVHDIKVVMATNMVPTATVDVPLRGGSALCGDCWSINLTFVSILYDRVAGQATHLKLKCHGNVHVDENQ